MRKIFVVGSLNMDMVFRIPGIPKRGETLMGDGFLMNSGGKGANQAVACARQKMETRMVGTVGDDVFGKALIQNLLEARVDVSHVRKHSNASTGTALILLTGSDNRIVVAGGANLETSPMQIEEALNDAQPGDVLLLQMEIPYDSVAFGLAKGKSKGMITILNPAPAQLLDESLLKNVDVIVPNETEAEKITGISFESPLAAARSVQYFLEQGVKEVVITMGSVGCVYGNASSLLNVPAYPVEVIDTTAAGDTFVGTLAVALASGSTVLSALPFANAAAALAISKLGAQCSIPTLDEVKKFLRKFDSK